MATLIYVQPAAQYLGLIYIFYKPVTMTHLTIERVAMDAISVLRPLLQKMQKQLHHVLSFVTFDPGGPRSARICLWQH